jgi:hypothetical protein
MPAFTALGNQQQVSHNCELGSSILFLSDAKDLDQLGRNKITHIISIHESPQPLMQVLESSIPGLHRWGGGLHPFIMYLLCARSGAAFFFFGTGD